VKRFFATLALLLALPAAAHADSGKRVALVVGNGAYVDEARLSNPPNDATDFGAALQRLGFDTEVVVNQTRAQLDRALRRFGGRMEGATVSLFYYAGHGLQVNGKNYLLPVDAKLESERDLFFEALEADEVLNQMQSQTDTNVIILDACRNNPFAHKLARTANSRSTAALGSGLAQMNAGRGTLIVYATQPGNVAADGGGRNSPFTSALLSNIAAPGLEARQVLTRVRGTVIEATKGAQVPWDLSSLTGDLYFAAPGRQVVAESRPASRPTEPVGGATRTAKDTSADRDALFWRSIKDSKSPADFDAYLQQFPAGTFAPLAHNRLAELRPAAPSGPPQKPPAGAATARAEPASPAPPRAPVDGSRKYAGTITATSSFCPGPYDLVMQIDAGKVKAELKGVGVLFVSKDPDGGITGWSTDGKSSVTMKPAGDNGYAFTMARKNGFCTWTGTVAAVE
jgi:uncharacterized caspase-like protein